jgi:ABC-type spermidine/putrescine transport system permease subunit I
MIYRQSIILSQVGYGAAISVMVILLALVMGVAINVRPWRSRTAAGAS